MMDFFERVAEVMFIYAAIILVVLIAVKIASKPKLKSVSLTPEQRRVMDRALRRSVRIIA